MGVALSFFKNYFVFNKDVCARSTRQSNLLHLPAIRTEVARKSFYYYGTTIFNNCKCTKSFPHLLRFKCFITIVHIFIEHSYIV